MSGGHDGSCSVPESGREANRVRLPGHPFATHHRRVVGMERYGHSRAGFNHMRRPAPMVGSADPANSQPGRVRTSRRLLHIAVEAADLMVPESVEHQSEEFASGSHSGDVAAPTLGDAGEAVPDRGTTVIAGNRLHR